MSRTAEKSNRAPDASGPPLRAFAMVLISLAILFAGLGFASFGGSDDEAATAASTTESEAAAPTTAAPAQPVATGGNAASQSSTDPRSAAAQTSATTPPAPTSTAAIPTSRNSAPVAAAPRAGVRVFNNSNVSGLAAQTATLLEDEGFTITDTGNYSEGLLTATAVYYGTTAGEKETALEVADALGVTAQPRFAGIADTGPGVIVIVVQQ